MNDAIGHRLAGLGNALRNEHQGQRRGQCKADPGGQCATIARLRQPQGDTDLTAGGAGQELTERDQVRVATLA
ncbi:hypothetical protein D3C78_1610400 [compost metagenome]